MYSRNPAVRGITKYSAAMIRKNTKFVDGIRDLIATREAGLGKGCGIGKENVTRDRDNRSTGYAELSWKWRGNTGSKPSSETLLKPGGFRCFFLSGKNVSETE